MFNVMFEIVLSVLYMSKPCRPLTTDKAVSDSEAMVVIMLSRQPLRFDFLWSPRGGVDATVYVNCFMHKNI